MGSRSNDLYSTTNGNSEEKIQIVKAQQDSIETGELVETNTTVMLSQRSRKQAQG